MPALRELLSEAGFTGVETYLQSGNVVLSSQNAPEQVAAACERAIAVEFGFDVSVLVRTRDELAEVVKGNPLRKVADDPKRYQVVFLSEELDAGEVEKLAALAAPSERFVALDRELYCWHPDGIGRSRLATRVASKNLGVIATARNWTTVEQLRKMADG
jgi:uncharacterized protein (DUF1697 family)